jgi:hypothetical protein
MLKSPLFDMAAVLKPEDPALFKAGMGRKPKFNRTTLKPARTAEQI